MRKKERKRIILIGIFISMIILVLILLIVLFIFWMKFPQESNNYEKEQKNILLPNESVYENNSNDNTINFFKLHWEHMPITYSFTKENVRNSNVKCQDYQIERIRKAFQIIENDTGRAVSFKEVESKGDILVYCNAAKADSQLLMRQGDGYYEYHGDVIDYGELNFYIHKNCGIWPDVEIHEILHVFGFNHTDSKKSIMYPTASVCDLGKIDQDIINDLINRYTLQLAVG